MPNLIVTEFSGIGRLSVPSQQAPVGPPIAAQVVAIGETTTATTGAVNDATALLRLKAEATCNVAISAEPNAETGIVIPLDAGETAFFGIHLSSGFKVAVVARAED